jgi:tripartite-type tricarboxylate transporter receptor subunit TctC
MKRMFLRVMALGLALAAFGAGAQTQWPQKPVRIINPFPAGGGVDVFARPIAAKISQSTGQNFFVENMGGAGGTVGAAAAAGVADGYTFLVGAIHHTIAACCFQSSPTTSRRTSSPLPCSHTCRT